MEAPVTIDTKQGVKTIIAGEGIFVRHDAYKMVITGFSKPVISIVYILAVFFLGLHLSHAIQSMFQTLGFSGPKLTPTLITVSKVIGWGIFIAFASIPTSVLLFGLGKGVLG